VTSVVRVRLVSWDEEAARLSAIRRRVFVEEQQVPLAIELDGLDPACVHALAEDHDGRALGTARLLSDGHLGRMAVLADARRRGVGSALLEELLRAARARGLTQVLLHAQLHACAFYAAHGFEVTSEVYLEAGIEHCEMRLSL
jgi:predicted GNAT family N-acyltransferase